MVHNHEDDAMNKIPLKSASGLDDEEKNGGEFLNDTAAAEEARREQMRVNILNWMKKLTIVLICFIGIALISYVLISLIFGDWRRPSRKTALSASSNSSILSDDTTNNNNNSHMLAGNSTSPDSTSNNGLNATHIAGLATATGTPITATTIAAAAATTTATPVTAAATVNLTPSSSSDIGITTTTELAQQTATETENVDAATDAVTNDAAAKALLDIEDTPITTPKFASKLGVFKAAGVSSDREVCSQIGSNILQQGGSAVDGAIATLLCNGIVTMQSMGIGGGLLMNVYIKDSKHAYAIDAREVAPYAATPDMFDHNLNLSLHGGLAIAVPGELMGYHRAHERFGKLPWKTLIEPSIKLCREGFYLSQHQWTALHYKGEHWKNNTVITNAFVNSTTGKLHPVGTKVQPQKELCDTYVLLAKNGPMDFYNGTLAKLVAEDLKDLGSTVTAYDLESYFADLVSSITMQLGDDILYAVPPVSSGTVVANILSILEGYNFSRADLKDAEHEATTIHRFVEAMKFGYAKRAELGDLRFNDVRELVSQLTNPGYASEKRSLINDSTVLNTTYGYEAEYAGVDDVGTSHTVVLAPNGDAVSVTSSINDYFGAGQAGKRTGILFNSAMNDFSVNGQKNMFGLPPSPSNTIDARKRPMSSMSPLILADQKGDVRLALGAAGGSKIISAIVEVVARVIWFGQNIKEAIDAPRFHHQLLPNVLEYQINGIRDEVLKLLKAKGHQTKSYNDTGSVVNAIVRNSTAVYVNADYRKQGGIAGF